MGLVGVDELGSFVEARSWNAGVDILAVTGQAGASYADGGAHAHLAKVQIYARGNLCSVYLRHISLFLDVKELRVVSAVVVLGLTVLILRWPLGRHHICKLT